MAAPDGSRIVGARWLGALLQPWAIHPDMLGPIAGVAARKLADREATWAGGPYQPRPVAMKGQKVAILPIDGVLAPRANMMTEFSGGTSLDQASQSLARLVADPAIGTIVLDINSPGGSVSGVTTFARQVLAARVDKRIVAQVDDIATSAAYWIAACAHEIVAVIDGTLGSIGVYSIHENLAKALEQEGIAVTYISAGKYKVEGNKTGPLSEEAYAHRQALVDEAYGRFVTDVARGRGVTEAAVRNGYGEGRVVSAEMGKSLGMIDGIATLDETLDRLTAGGTQPVELAAEARVDTPQDPASARDTGQDPRADDRRFLRELEVALRKQAC
jgi:signal peptide peptidase SppA